MVIVHSYVKLPEGRSENGVGESALWEHLFTDQMWSRNLQKMHGEVSLCFFAVPISIGSSHSITTIPLYIRPVFLLSFLQQPTYLAIWMELPIY